MDLKEVLPFPPYPGDYLHPVVYACTALMLLCVLISITTYVIYHRVIRISRKGWHILLNFLFHTAVTFGMFAGGINLINYPLVCQVVGVILHYSSLSTMLWLVLIAQNTCREVSKAPRLPQDRNLQAQPRQKVAVLRLYLFGGGVPLIIVGITAGVSMDNYGSGDDAPYCWMAWEPSLGGFYAPVAFLVLMTCVYFLCTSAQLKRHPGRKYELRATATGELGHCRAAGGEPGDHTGCTVITASMLANEHSFKAQLRSTAFTVLLVLATWAFGALAVTQGHILDMIFSCLYGASSVTLGLFLLIQHCAKRDDVWRRWWACCPSKPKVGANGEAGGGARVESRGGFEIAPAGSYLHSSPCLHTRSPHCSLSSLPIGQVPVSPYCAASPTPGARLCPRSLPEEPPRPALPLHSCLKDGTTPCSFARPRPCLRDYRVTSSSLDGSVHGPHLDSPHSLRVDSPLASCQGPHPDNQLHRTSSGSPCNPPSPCEARACHRRVPSAEVGTFSARPRRCPRTDPGPGTEGAEGARPGAEGALSDMVTETDDSALCLDIPPPRASVSGSQATCSQSRRGTTIPEDYSFNSDPTGNIRTGPWKNETTV